MIIILRSIISGDPVQIIASLLAMIVIVFITLPIHEYAHGWMAYKLGDPTAKNQGRLDLNPLKHFDLVGTTMLILTGFGWAKPVPVNPFFFKDRKKGMALTALAGPVANILIATITLALWKVVAIFLPDAFFITSFATILVYVIRLIILINLGLAVFNLLPVPPLDGSKILGFFLPDHINDLMYRNERYISYALFALIMFTNILNTPLYFLQNLLFKGIDFLTGFIDLLGRLI